MTTRAQLAREHEQKRHREAKVTGWLALALMTLVLLGLLDVVERMVEVVA